MKRRVPLICKQHTILDEWQRLNSTIVFAEKLDVYDNIRCAYVKKDTIVSNRKKEFTSQNSYKKQNRTPYVPRSHEFFLSSSNFNSSISFASESSRKKE
ncbi:hypothetical protein CEXT_486241 [Caerostris extrusa]|uniref:Ycf1 n=1 Tax=Caerostris extrusa TaxID=172846 RepID=A0AAV4N360_CAEEX|nr:hypothetical protein CEXT_486241 [Caerostris extrusa]